MVRLRQLLRLWFHSDDQVGRRAYLLSGLALMCVKYAVDTLMIVALGADWLDPIAYLNPIMTGRVEALGDAPDGLLVAMVVWGLPFLWIGVSMSIRRARSAGVSPYFGLFFLVPVLNWLLIAWLCGVPAGEPRKPPTPKQIQRERSVLRSASTAVVLLRLLGSAFAALIVYAIGSYGSGLFVALPFAMGALSAGLVAKQGHADAWACLLTASISLSVSFGVLLIFALEGAICILMAAVIGYPISWVGALVGRALAQTQNRASANIQMWLMVPALAWAGASEPAAKVQHEVTTKLELSVPPATVWPNVVGFSDLPPPSHWVMKSGIAVPLRARIDGEGVGAIRHCEFTTGPFVEPITRWEPPHLLAFDVTEQPHTMRELSFYDVIHAPHLKGTFNTRRGQFRLTPSAAGGTTLYGTTWYELDMAPTWYWSFLADQVVSVIHDRVLSHIKDLSEAQKPLARALPVSETE